MEWFYIKWRANYYLEQGYSWEAALDLATKDLQEMIKKQNEDNPA